MERGTNRLTGKRLQEILKQHGVRVTLEEAEKMADFMNMLAKIVVERYIQSKKSDV